MLTLVVFVIILSLLVFVHEFGHFITAKKLGVKVEEFGFGFPPRLFGLKRKGTVYSINWIPIGGFVKIKGEQGEGAGESDSFVSKKIWQRGLIISSGVLMNYLLAAIILSLGFTIGLPAVLDGSNPETRIKERNIQILSVYKDYPADETGLQSGDIIVSIDQKQFKGITEIQEYNKSRAGSTINVVLKRGRTTIEKSMALKPLEDDEGGIMGVALAETGLVSYPWYQAILLGFKGVVVITWQILVALFEILKKLVIAQPVAIDVAGPVGIAIITRQVTQLGFTYILQFVALLSINLAIINFLPFPALDGGRFLFLALEKIRGRAVNRRIEALVHNFGFFVLIALIILITVRDLSRFGVQISELFKRITGG